MCHQCETVVRCAAGKSETVAVEIGLHQRSAFSPFLFAIMMDSLTENIRIEAFWQLTFADDVVLCVRGKYVLELLTWAVEGSREEEMNESVKSKNRVGLHVYEWNAIRKC